MGAMAFYQEMQSEEIILPTITLHLDKNGRPAGITEKDDRLYAAFKFRIKNLGKESITFSWKEPRSSGFHRRHFKMLNTIFEAQDAFKDTEAFRKWAEMCSGYADFVPAPSGVMCAISKSIAYDKLDQKEFQEIHENVFQFLRSDYARKYLWTHLPDTQSAEMVESLLREFES